MPSLSLSCPICPRKRVITILPNSQGSHRGAEQCQAKLLTPGGLRESGAWRQGLLACPCMPSPVLSRRRLLMHAL